MFLMKMMKRSLLIWLMIKDCCQNLLTTIIIIIIVIIILHAVFHRSCSPVRLLSICQPIWCGHAISPHTARMQNTSWPRLPDSVGVSAEAEWALETGAQEEQYPTLEILVSHTYLSMSWSGQDDSSTGAPDDDDDGQTWRVKGLLWRHSFITALA